MDTEQLLIETHPLPPFLPPNAKLLMLGSFPPPRERWKMDFYYPNFQNDMWRIFGWVFFDNRDYFVETGSKAFKEDLLRAFLWKQGVAISDAAYQVQRLQGNAADKFLQIVETVDLVVLLDKIPLCHTIMTTGELATETVLSLLPKGTIKPKVGAYVEAVLEGRVLRLYRLPSSSRAYPLALDKKAAVYRQFFQEMGWIGS